MSAPPSSHSRRLFLQRSVLGVAGLGLAPAPILGAAASRPDTGSGSAACPAAGGADAQAPSRHPIASDGPAANFMEGSILGNGEMGVVVEPRPDVILIHVGHNAVWDQRMMPIDREKLKDFRFAMERIQAIPHGTEKLMDDAWFRDYQAAGKDSYAARKYPRPHCCGTIALGFDRRKVEMMRHRVRIVDGLCAVEMRAAGEMRVLEIIVEPDANNIRARLVDGAGNPVPSFFRFLAILSDGSIPREFPNPATDVDLKSGIVGYRQVLPYEEFAAKRDYRPHPKDRAFVLTARTSGILHQDKPMPGGTTTGAWCGQDSQPMYLVVSLAQGLDSALGRAAWEPPAATSAAFAQAASAAAASWAGYWARSSVRLDDELLERTWYWNMYFLRCALHPRTVSPGLYAICPYPHRETWWHGDYHMDYNAQQAFWSTFSSNHPELNLPYVAMVHHVLPHAREWAKNYYGMRGACFPVSSYPVELRGYPYGAPVFNWMMCLSTWTVQGLWWHYVYTRDLDYLRERGFEPIKAVAQFMIDYVNRPDVKQKEWADDRVHIWPSFPPEVYGLMPGLPREYNADNLVDITLLRFVLLAYLKACRELGVAESEAADMRDAQDILDRLPPYPSKRSDYGEIFVSVPAEDPEKVYNVPINLMSVFPGEHHGLHSHPAELEIAKNTAASHQNEGGNEIVFLSLQKARLGMLDLEKFKREIVYALMPNGTCTDKNLQIGGRFGFSKTREYDWMAGFGIWFENFALPVVINECLLQSYAGEMRFFPNWPGDKTASFRSLRAAGAFLVSAEFAGGRVQRIAIESEKGGDAVIVSPWKTGLAWSSNRGTGGSSTEGRIAIPTEPGETLELTPA